MPAEPDHSSNVDPPISSKGETPPTGELGISCTPLLDILLPPQQTDELGWLGPYRVLRVLGRGGMGIVFLGEDPQLKRAVALKLMHPHLAANPVNRERFLREGQAVAALDHEQVVTIFQVGEQKGVPYLAMKLLQGETLHDRLKREGPLPVKEVLGLGVQMALGLEAAHQKGLIHRDLKPTNLWLEKDSDRVILLDFGLARASSEEEESQLTQDGVIVGTPAFMSPEQAKGGEVDERSDLYSLGCVLYRMCVGEPSPRGKETVVDPQSVTRQKLPPLIEKNPALPAALSELILQLLAIDPAQRPSSARAVIQRLEEIENALHLSIQSDPSNPPLAKGGKSNVPPFRKEGIGGVALDRKVVPEQPRSSWPVWIDLVLLGLLAAAGGVVALVLIPLLSNPDPNQTGKKPGTSIASANKLRLLIPAYFYPGGPGMKEWDKLLKAATQVEIIAIINPSTGPGMEPDPNYTTILNEMLKVGVLPIGYVPTHYGKRPAQQVEKDVQRWFQFYPQVQGLFLDEQASEGKMYKYYLDIAQLARQKKPGALIVTNPGAFCDPVYLVSPAINIVCVTEHGKDVEPRIPEEIKQETLSKLAFLMYKIESREKMNQLLAGVSQQKAGYLYITDADLPNPWERLPKYWEEMWTAPQWARNPGLHKKP